MSKYCPQSESMKALEQSLIDHMEICRLKRKAKRLKAENALLKAEVESLKEAWVDKKMQEDRDALLLEVERLRKAGDELALSLAAFHLLHRGSIDTTTQPDIVAWNAAKEGKQP